MKRALKSKRKVQQGELIFIFGRAFVANSILKLELLLEVCFSRLMTAAVIALKFDHNLHFAVFGSTLVKIGFSKLEEKRAYPDTVQST